MTADLVDTDAARQLVSQTRPDLIFHFSGHVTATPELAAVRPTFETLLHSAVSVLIAATEAGCQRIVLPGSLVEPEPGQTDVAPTSPYVAAKWAATTYARMFHALYETPVVIVRPAMTYGPGQPPSRLIPYVIRSLLAGEAPQLSTGRFEADWTYIDDMVAGIVAAARTPGIEGATLDLGTGKTASARAVIELTVQLMATPVRPAFGAVPDRPGDRVRAADVELTRSRIGWAASTSLDEGLRRTIAWYTAQRS